MSATPVPAQTVVPPLGRLRIPSRLVRGSHGDGRGRIVAYQNPGNLAGLRDTAHTLGVLMVAVAAILAIALGVPYVVRWIEDALTGEFTQP